MTQITSVKYAAILGVTLIGNAVTANAASIQEDVTVTTSTLAGSKGSVDLSFNPGIVAGTQPALVNISQLSGVSLDTGHPAVNTGDVIGTMTTSLQLDNGKQLNQAFTPVVFGSSFNFLLTISGPAVDTPDPNASYGSNFVLAFTSTDGSAPLLTTDGILATVTLGPGSKGTSIKTFTPDATITPVGAAIPEPSTGGLAAAWMGFIWAVCAVPAYFRRRRTL